MVRHLRLYSSGANHDNAAGLLVPNPILSKDTVREMFIPSLTEKGSKSLSELIMAPGLQWGTTMALVTKDWPKRRKQGSAFCKLLLSTRIRVSN